MQDGKPKVLCVEDDPDYREGIRAIIESGGYDVVEAASAEDGLIAFKEHRPDFVIVDLMMEEVDAGRVLVKEIRAIEHHVPIYMLTSVGDSLSMSTNVRELGLDGVLQKPVSRENLLSLLRSKVGA